MTEIHAHILRYAVLSILFGIAFVISFTITLRNRDSLRVLASVLLAVKTITYATLGFMWYAFSFNTFESYRYFEHMFRINVISDSIIVVLVIIIFVVIWRLVEKKNGRSNKANRTGDDSAS